MPSTHADVHNESLINNNYIYLYKHGILPLLMGSLASALMITHVQYKDVTINYSYIWVVDTTEHKVNQNMAML